MAMSSSLEAEVLELLKSGRAPTADLKRRVQDHKAITSKAAAVADAVAAATRQGVEELDGKDTSPEHDQLPEEIAALQDGLPVRLSTLSTQQPETAVTATGTVETEELLFSDEDFNVNQGMKRVYAVYRRLHQAVLTSKYRHHHLLLQLLRPSALASVPVESAATGSSPADDALILCVLPPSMQMEEASVTLHELAIRMSMENFCIVSPGVCNTVSLDAKWTRLLEPGRGRLSDFTQSV